MAETERFELSVPYSQHDGLAIPEQNLSERRFHRKNVYFHDLRCHAERASCTSARSLSRHKSRHTTIGGELPHQNGGSGAKRAKDATAVTERPLEGLAPFAAVQGIAEQLWTQDILRRNHGQAPCRTSYGREGSHEHYPCA
jgi:hypothetical protein